MWALHREDACGDSSRPRWERTWVMKLKRGFRQLVDEAKARIETLSLEDARQRYGREDVVVWLDPESPYHKPIFASGKESWRSALADDAAQQMGLPKVSAWKNAGYPVAEREKKKA